MDRVTHPMNNAGPERQVCLPTIRCLSVVIKGFSGQKHGVTTQINDRISDGNDN